MSVDQTPTRQSQTPGIDHLGRGGDDTLWNSACRQGILAAFVMRGSHLTGTTFGGKKKRKKHLSAFAFFQQHAKNSSAGTEQGKADYTFWLMAPYTFREISSRSLIYLRISSRNGTGAKPWTQTPWAFRQFGRGSEFSPINCLVPTLPLTANLLPASISCSLRPLLNKPSPE